MSSGGPIRAADGWVVISLCSVTTAGRAGWGGRSAMVSGFSGGCATSTLVAATCVSVEAMAGAGGDGRTMAVTVSVDCRKAEVAASVDRRKVLAAVSVDWRSIEA